MREEEILTELRAVENNMEIHQEELATYEGELLDPSEIEQVDTAVDAFESSLSDFLEDYSVSLTNERDFFTRISEEDASYEDFVDGIETINDERESLTEPLTNLDDMLVNLDEAVTQLQSSIEEQLSEEE
ncbi:MAG: YkyA family protein [Alkalibacterium sp.]|nr:YkyA family protein [Alkalibacterium sp.]